MSKSAIISHQNGWSCTLDASVKMTYVKQGEFMKEKPIAILTDVFNHTGVISVGDSVDILVKDNGSHHGKVIGVAKGSNSIRVELNKEVNNNYSDILNKVKQWQDKY